MSDNLLDLPQEIISEILLRLPVKSIGRSRCVCKPWLSLLTSYDFIKAHHTHFAHEENLLLHDYCSLINITLPLGGNHLRKLEFFDEGVRSLVGSCNGLVLVESKLKFLCLINCLTQEYVKLPLPAGFDTLTKFSTYGFGYDSISDDYKIVSISAPKKYDKANTFVDIYSLKMRSWRKLGTYPYDYDTLNDKSGVFVNGALHWTRSLFSDNESPVIVAFDLNSEKFNDIPAPASIHGYDFSFGMLMVINGCLGIAVELFPDIYAEIWYMKSYSMVESWTKLAIVIDMEFTHIWVPSCFHKDKILFEDGDLNFKWYYLKDGKKEVCLDYRDMRGLNYGITYLESLVSPHFNSQN